MSPLFFSAFPDPRQVLEDTHPKVESFLIYSQNKTSNKNFPLPFCTLYKMHSTARRYYRDAPSQEELKLGHEVRPRAVESPRQDFTARVCDQQGVLKLSRPLPVSCHRGPAIWPGFILPSTFTNHWFNCKYVAGFHHSNCFIFGIMGYIGGCMKKLVDSMPTIASNN